jgi:hypothetical protein
MILFSKKVESAVLCSLLLLYRKKSLLIIRSEPTANQPLPVDTELLPELPVLTYRVSPSYLTQQFYLGGGGFRSSVVKIAVLLYCGAASLDQCPMFRDKL